MCLHVEKQVYRNGILPLILINSCILCFQVVIHLIIGILREIHLKFQMIKYAVLDFEKHETLFSIYLTLMHFLYLLNTIDILKVIYHKLNFNRIYILCGIFIRYILENDE